MAKLEVKVVRFGEREPVVYNGFKSYRLITRLRDNSDRISFHVFTAEAGTDLTGGYPRNDEVIYVLEGDPVITWKEGKAELHPKTALFIPAGTEYRYQAGPKKNLGIAAFSPAYYEK